LSVLSVLSALSVLSVALDLDDGFGADCGRGVRRETQARAAAGTIFAILEDQAAAVRFGDLAAQDEADARAARLRREERHEQVPGVRESWSFVLNPQLDRRRR